MLKVDKVFSLQKKIFHSKVVDDKIKFIHIVTSEM